MLSGLLACASQCLRFRDWTFGLALLRVANACRLLSQKFRRLFGVLYMMGTWLKLCIYMVTGLFVPGEAFRFREREVHTVGTKVQGANGPLNFRSHRTFTPLNCHPLP